jgi:hypothetical protein
MKPMYTTARMHASDWTSLPSSFEPGSTCA